MFSTEAEVVRWWILRKRGRWEHRRHARRRLRSHFGRHRHAHRRSVGGPRSFRHLGRRQFHRGGIGNAGGRLRRPGRRQQDRRRFGHSRGVFHGNIRCPRFRRTRRGRRLLQELPAIDHPLLDLGDRHLNFEVPGMLPRDLIQSKKDRLQAVQFVDVIDTAIQYFQLNQRIRIFRAHDVILHS